jgi:UDP-N-acetylglucosamine pyrophosphorylase
MLVKNTDKRTLQQEVVLPRHAAPDVPNMHDFSSEGMNVIVPMGGIGSRFAKSGYRYPKPMINIVGRPMLFWLIDNLKLQENDTLWLALMRSVDDEFQISGQVQREFPHVKVQPVWLEFETRGAAGTCFQHD